MTLATLFHALSQVDAVLATVAAVVVVLVNEARRRRGGVPSRQRMMEALLSAILFWALGVRFAITALAVLVTPAAVLGPGVPLWGSLLWCAVSVGLAVTGWLTHRASVPMRVSGALALAVSALVEAALSVFVLQLPLLAVLDNGFAVVVAITTLVFAAFHWTHRTATPNPLGGDKRPLDY